MSLMSFNPLHETFSHGMTHHMMSEFRSYHKKVLNEIEEMQMEFGVSFNTSKHKEFPHLTHFSSVNIPDGTSVEFYDDGVVLQDRLHTYTKDGISKSSSGLTIHSKSGISVGAKYTKKTPNIVDSSHSYSLIRGKYISMLVVSDDGNFTPMKRRFYLVPSTLEFSKAIIIGDECWYEAVLSSSIQPSIGDMFSAMSVLSTGSGKKKAWYHAGSCTRVQNSPDAVLEQNKIFLRRDGKLITRQGSKLVTYTLDNTESSSSAGSPPPQFYSPPKSPPRSPVGSPPRFYSPPKSPPRSPVGSPPRFYSPPSSPPKSPKSPHKSKTLKTLGHDSSLPSFKEYMEQNNIPKRVPVYTGYDQELLPIGNGYAHFAGSGAIMREKGREIVAWVDEENGGQEVLPLNDDAVKSMMKILSEYDVRRPHRRYQWN